MAGLRLAAAVAAAACLASAASAAQPVKYIIEYSFDGVGYSKRGEATLRSAGGTQATVSQELSQEHVDRLYEAAGRGGDYFVRVRKEGDDDELAVQSFVSACSYYQSGMSDSVVLLVDSNDRPQSVQVSSTGKCKSTLKKKKITKLKTSLAVRRGDAGPLPFVDDYITQLKKKQEEGSEEQKGFLQKYWMYIVPVYLFMLLSSAGGGGGGGEGGGGGGGGAK